MLSEIPSGTSNSFLVIAGLHITVTQKEVRYLVTDTTQTEKDEKRSSSVTTMLYCSCIL
jgi:hypothetical protein